MKKVSTRHKKPFIFAALVCSLFFSACHFESDKDYKEDDGHAATDSTHRKDHGQEQHKESNPPVDAVKSSDSANHFTPANDNDSSIKKDSSKAH